MNTHNADLLKSDSGAQLQEPAFVVAVDGSTVWVEVFKYATCSRCAANSVCGHGLLQKGFAKRRVSYIPVFCEATTAALLSVGQRVDIVMPANSVVVAALLAYGLPLLGLLLGTLLADYFTSIDWYAVIGAVLGFAMSLVMARWLAERLRFHPRFRPVLLANN